MLKVSEYVCYVQLPQFKNLSISDYIRKQFE